MPSFGAPLKPNTQVTRYISDGHPFAVTIATIFAVVAVVLTAAGGHDVPVDAVAFVGVEEGVDAVAGVLLLVDEVAPEIIVQLLLFPLQLPVLPAPAPLPLALASIPGTSHAVSIKQLSSSILIHQKRT